MYNDIMVAVDSPDPSEYAIEEEGVSGWRVLGPEGAIAFRILKRQVPMYHERLRVHPVYNGLNGTRLVTVFDNYLAIGSWFTSIEYGDGHILMTFSDMKKRRYGWEVTQDAYQLVQYPSRIIVVEAHAMRGKGRLKVVDRENMPDLAIIVSTCAILLGA